MIHLYGFTFVGISFSLNHSIYGNETSYFFLYQKAVGFVSQISLSIFSWNTLVWDLMISLPSSFNILYSSDISFCFNNWISYFNAFISFCRSLMVTCLIGILHLLYISFIFISFEYVIYIIHIYWANLYPIFFISFD